PGGYVHPSVLWEPVPRASFSLSHPSHLPPYCYYPAGGSNETHDRSSPAAKKRTRTRTATAPANRCSTRGAGKQLERHTHDVCSRSEENQPGPEGAMGKGKGARSEAHDLSG